MPTRPDGAKEDAMADPGTGFDDVVERLKRMRDEIELKIHLGRADAKQEWEELERRWQELKTKSAPAQEVAGDTARNVASALGLAAEELKKGYERLRKLL